MKNKVNIGMIGLGNRGSGLLKEIILQMDDIEVLAVCDLYEDRREAAANLVEEKRSSRPVITSDYHEVLRIAEIDAVVIATSWEAHSEIAIAAMEAGKYVGSEVGGAFSVNECWKLVEAYERT